MLVSKKVLLFFFSIGTYSGWVSVQKISLERLESRTHRSGFENFTAPNFKTSEYSRIYVILTFRVKQLKMSKI